MTRFLVFLLLCLPAFAQQVVISQVYGGGGNSGATLRNDFVELFNRGAAAVNITGWSVQYASSAGTTWQKTDLLGTIQPGQYYLIQQSAGAGGTVNLPTPDAVGNIAMSATAGKIALVNNGTLLSGSAPSGAQIIDVVGYGTANFSEGSGPAPTLSNTTAALRLNNGCTDTNNNVSDFLAGPPNPRNTSSPLQVCAAGPSCPTTKIDLIQGSGATSPLVGAVVGAAGIVTARRSNGFFIQAAVPEDSDPATSEGVLVFTGGAPPAIAAVGNLVCVVGTVTEFKPASDPNSPPVTELTGPSVAVVSTGQPLPAPVVLGPGDTDPTGPIDFLERYEGMRVQANGLTVIAPTLGSVNEANATATSNGVFYAVLGTIERPFREPGIDAWDYASAGAPPGTPRFDTNPERLRVDSDAQSGAPALNVATGAIISSLTGPLDYAFRTYTILPDPAPPPTISDSRAATPVPDATDAEITVASVNLQRLFDAVDDPSTGDPVLTPAAFTNRLAKISLAFRGALRLPDIVGVQEAENLAALQSLATRINNDVVAAGQPNPNYQAYLVEGNDIGGIDVGFLVRSTRVTVDSVTQEGKTATYLDPNTGLPATLNDRPPLVLRATATRPGSLQSLKIVAIVNHLRSLDGIDDPADGPRVRAKRRAQAEFLANLIQSIQAADLSANIISVGDYNAFQFNDGYVDAIGTVIGIPTPPNQVVLASPDLVNPDLTDLIGYVSQAERYSYLFDGNAQVLDHILVNPNLLSRFGRMAFARVDADFPEVMRNDPNRPERFSDHDAPVAYFTLPFNRAPIANAGPDQVVAAGAGCRVMVALDGRASSDPDGDSLTYTWTGSFGTVTGPTPTVSLGVGVYDITLTVTDPNGNTASDVTRVVVTGTEFSLAASPSILWPPNNKLVPVSISLNGLCDASLSCRIVGVSSNEPVGNDPDWNVTGNLTLQLRAQREGKGGGRIYTIEVRCGDTARFVTVTVPHDQGK